MTWTLWSPYQQEKINYSVSPADINFRRGDLFNVLSSPMPLDHVYV